VTQPGASRQSVAGRNPVLDAAQLDVLRRYGLEHEMAAGDILFADGDVAQEPGLSELILRT
jgi:hypothetical protein